MRYNEFTIEGRNAVIEAFRSGKPIDRLFILDGAQEGAIQTIKKEAKKHDTTIKFVTKERLDQISETGKHQGVIAYAAAYEYVQVADILERARQKNEPPFLFLLDNMCNFAILPNLPLYMYSLPDPLFFPQLESLPRNMDRILNHPQLLLRILRSMPLPLILQSKYLCQNLYDNLIGTGLHIA